MPVDSRAPRGPVSEAPPRRSAAQRTVMMSEAPPKSTSSPPSRTVNSLPPPSSASEPAPINFAAQTDVGNQREHNEDNFLVDRKLRLYVVCDGMGGHAAGEVASAVAVRTLSEEIRKAQDLMDDYVAGSTGGNKVNKRDITNMLGFAVNCASRKIHSEALLDEKKRGMGTTLVAALFVGHQVFIVHVGDSRIYLLRNANLEQLTEDHNVYNEFIKKKKIDLGSAAKLAPKEAITRAVGVYEHCEPETLVIDVAPGDRFLLCTDGLSGYFEAPEGSMDELAHKLNQPDPDSVVGDLVSTAKHRGGKDNITAVLVTLGAIAADDAQRLRDLEAQKAILSGTSLFGVLNARELRQVLQVTEVEQYQDRQTIVREGEQGEQLYIVLTGQVEVMRTGAPVARLDPGEHFGEMALIRNQPRSASARAVGPTQLMVIHRKDFFEILRTEHRLAVKLLWQFTGVLANRLAETTRNLGIARDELIGEDIQCQIFGADDETITSELP
jgi:serine/threonine protein phosphatase PrpC/CRP-like cAMP-binding protein